MEKRQETETDKDLWLKTPVTPLLQVRESIS